MLVKFNTKESYIPEKTLDVMEKKLQSRLHRYFGNDEDTQIFVKIAERKYLFKAELTLPYCGYTLRAETTDDKAALAAVDKAIDIMERQIVKCKTKLSRSKHQVIEPIQDAPSVPEEPERYQIVRTKNYEMKPMTVQEAILNMNLLGHNFYMFFNSEDNKIETVYRRNDGAYGLIEPLK